MTARPKSADAVGSYYTGTGIADQLAEQVVALRPRSVLDPACGDGALLAAVRARLPDVPLYGMDRDVAAVEACRARGFDARVGDSLFDGVPTADVWILNPPYLGGLKISSVIGPEYLRRIQKQWGKNGTADLCSYWLRRADDLGVRAMAGVFTNTISQGDTRECGLKYLLQESDWEIHWARTNQKWNGERAAVTVTLIALRRIIQWVDAEPARPAVQLRAAAWSRGELGDWVRIGAASVRPVYRPAGTPPYPYEWSARGSEGGWCSTIEEGMRAADAALLEAGWVVAGATPSGEGRQLDLFGRAA